MTTKEIVKLIKTAIEDKKGENIKIIDISNISVIADYFIIASANNHNQLRAIKDEIEEKLSKEGLEPKQIEGNRSATWILMDYQDVVIHLFDKEQRLFYDLDRIWTDGKILEDI